MSKDFEVTEAIKHHPKTSDGLVLCCDLQTKVTISPTLEDEPTPKSSTKPDKTISDDAADSPSTSNMPYNPQRETTTRPSLQDEPKCKSISPIPKSDDSVCSAKTARRKVPQRSKRISNFMGDDTKRDVIPIGSC
ncbi:hypothetical protein FRX31_030656 [Thalictrum thalictroides]|uniref:Uncharacterized protein n=1 Tax=Thalictrum thalictroides TaxID=46969 RepID=A0A7J6V6F2_THATH|nr:hypothetical protein FRX31_030656 [Thalictrum thalictroides]